MAGLAPSPAALARNLAYLQIDLTDRYLYPLLLRQAHATRDAYRAYLAEAVEAGEVTAGTEVDALARAVDTAVSGSFAPSTDIATSASGYVSPFTIRTGAST